MSEYRVYGELYEIDGRGSDGDCKVADIILILFAKDEVEAIDHATDVFGDKFYIDLNTIVVEKT